MARTQLSKLLGGKIHWFTCTLSIFSSINAFIYLNICTFSLFTHPSTHPSHPAIDLVLTLMSILPRRLWGLGNVLDSLLSASPTSSLSPKISRRYWAIFFCCWMLQWFSMDRITGNLEETNRRTVCSYSAFHKWQRTCQHVENVCCRFSEWKRREWSADWTSIPHLQPTEKRGKR